jgi:hypothetical protein
MSFAEQEYYIDSLNKKCLNSDYHLIRLSDDIDFGYFWSAPRAGQSRTLRFDYLLSKLYLIKYEGIYCSIIEDMGLNDVQVFTKSDFRNKQIVFNAFQKTIFSHLKLSRKFQQVTTTQDNLEAKKLIEKLGFKLIDTKNGRLIFKKSLKNITSIEIPNITIEKIILEEYQLSISQCFEMIDLISKHLELAGNHGTLFQSIKQSIKWKSKIMNDFYNEINSEDNL